MIQRKGLLLVTMEPPASLEEEFNDWYDTEHVPQRRSITGFENAQRFTCLTGWPRYLALYDLSSLDIIEREAYQAISGPYTTPWSRRMFARVVGYYRAVAEQVYPGNASLSPDRHILRLVFIRLAQAVTEQEDVIVGGLRGVFNQHPGLAQLRIFKSSQRHGYDFFGLAEFHTPVSESSISVGALTKAGLSVDLVNIYTPYWH